MTFAISLRYPDVTAEAAEAELLREAASRARAYPGQVAKGNMTAEVSDYEQRLVPAWLEDVARWKAHFAGGLPAAPLPAQPLTQGFTWDERRRGLARELDRRARLYPRWIERGDMDRASADRQVRRLTAVLDLYDEGWDWHAPNGARPNFGGADRTPEQHEARTAWLDHSRHVLIARNGGAAAQQKEMAF